jgi:hypothetical protein
LKHLTENGDDVTTEVIFESTDQGEIEEFAEFVSEELDVVCSKEYANLIPERGHKSGNTKRYDTQMVLNVPSELKTGFMNVCQELDESASFIIRHFMRDFVKKHK